MIGIWKLGEARLVQQIFSSSAADALSKTLSAVPAGKVWVVLAAFYYPSAAETQTVSFGKISAAGTEYGILNPVSLALNPEVATFIEQGMEYPLFPGEALIVRRGDHTAGSTMNFGFQFVEVDLPLYTYDEPQVVKRQARALSSIASQLGGGLGSMGSRGPIGPGDTGGRRGGPLER